MAFPSSPTNGQQVTVNNIVYTYNSTKGAWIRLSTPGVPLAANALTLSDTTQSTNTLTGALLVAGGAGIEKNVNIGQNLTVAQAITTGNITITNYVDSNISVAGNATITGNATIGSFYSYFKRVTLDFGTTPVYNKTIYINDERAQIGARVFVTPSAYTTNVFAQFGRDELEFDNFLCAANVVAAGNIAMYITSQPGPVKGERNFDYILG